MAAASDPDGLRRQFLEDSAGGMLPPALVPLFDARFVRSSALYEEFTFRLALQVFRATDLERVAREPGTTKEIAARASLEPERALVPLDWILRQIAAHGGLEHTVGQPGEAPRFRLSAPLPRLNPAEIEQAQLAYDPSWLPAYRVAETAAIDYPDFLRGLKTGEEILFSPPRLNLWFDYFSNKNRLYEINNRIAAVAAQEWRPAGRLRILELGGGLGSGAIALLEQFETAGLMDEIGSYRFTEIVPSFLRRGQRNVSARFPDAPFLGFDKLDMDHPFAERGISPGSIDVVYAVNTLHVARDLAFTFHEIHRCLAPGGLLLISECIRPFPDQAVYAEFVFNLMKTFRGPQLDAVWRPNGGFLTPEQWSAGLRATGFRDIRFMPDIAKIRKKYPTFILAAVGATRGA